MAQEKVLLVKYGDMDAGLLTNRPDGGTQFQYDLQYLTHVDAKPISRALALQRAPYSHPTGLLPFFDNLVAEGWLQGAQARYLKLRPEDRFGLLSHFGFDCSGAVWIDNPESNQTASFIPDIPEDVSDPEAWLAAQSSRASLSGVQSKLLVRKTGKNYRPVGRNELSTHICKLESPDGQHPDIIDIEFLTSKATGILLKNDDVAEMEISEINLPLDKVFVTRKALMIKRFDRIRDRRIHFEELNQLLSFSSRQKYDGTYNDLAAYIRRQTDVIPTEVEKFVRRVLACVLLGNTDAHMKNFALFDVGGNRTLTPNYDMVAAALYPKYRVLALPFKGIDSPILTAIKPKHIADFALDAGLNRRQLETIIYDFESRLDQTFERIATTQNIHQSIKDKLTNMIEKRWNGTFKSIGAYLSKKPASAD